MARDATRRLANALVKHVSSSGDDLSAILIAVRNDVMKETQRKQVPWEHSALTGRFYFKPPAQAAVAAPAPDLPVRPPRYAVEQAGGLFSERDAQRLQSLADKHQLPLPDFQIEVPSVDVPASLRRFVGVWVDPEANARKVRDVMLIVTRVDKEGRADGYWTYGPPGPQSFDQGRALAFRMLGTITDGSLRFSSPSGWATYRHRLTTNGRMDYFYSNTKGQTANGVLIPVWTLVEAERAAKR